MSQEDQDRLAEIVKRTQSFIERGEPLYDHGSQVELHAAEDIDWLLDLITRLREENAQLQQIALQDNRYLVEMTQQRDRLVEEQARLKARESEAFKAGHYAQWIRGENRWIFDPLMKPGDAPSAFWAWQVQTRRPPYRELDDVEVTCISEENARLKADVRAVIENLDRTERLRLAEAYKLPFNHKLIAIRSARLDAYAEVLAAVEAPSA